MIASPQGLDSSAMTYELIPRRATSQTCAPSSSSHVRRQRLQRMQRLWSRTNRSCVASTKSFGEEVLVSDVVDAQPRRHRLQLAVAVHHADGADVVALGEQQLDDHLPVALDLRGLGCDPHLVLGPDDASRLESRRLVDLDQAEPAGADARQPLELAEGRDVDPVLSGDLEDRLACGGAAELAVDGNGDCATHQLPASCRAATPPTLPFGECISQTPAGQRFSTTCARYSSRKYRRVLSTGFGQVWPRAQRLAFRRRSAALGASSSSVGIALAVNRVVEQLEDLRGANPAGNALAAGLVLAEVDEEPGDVDHAGRLVHHDHAARAHDRADLVERVVVDRHIQVLAPGCSRRRGRRSGRP